MNATRHVMTAVCATLLWMVAHTAFGQSFVTLRNAPPTPVGLGFQLTDGTVMFQASNNRDWYRLTPDETGSYRNGDWSQLASLPPGYGPNAYASAVLADGRLVVIGGEYNGENAKFVVMNRGAIYDPVKDSWKVLGHPAGWDYIGDSPCAVLPDGKFMLGRKFDRRMATLDPATLTWTEIADTGKSDFNAEEGWTLLPDGGILTVDVKDAPNSERFTPATAAWASAGSTKVNLQEPVGGTIEYGNGLIYRPPGEIGPAILRPDGTVFATGGLHKGARQGHTAVFHLSTGAWTAGPDFPAGEAAGDEFSALLPNGHVLVESETNHLYEFDGATLTLLPRKAKGNGMLLLPTGEVILDGTVLYRPAGAPAPGWAPAVTGFPATVRRGGAYQIFGRQFNGLSQANAFGDEGQTFTNYPLVRITNTATGHVVYARTHDHSTMGVATGTLIVSTHFDVPKSAKPGPSTLVVVANGIPSKPVGITVR